VIKRALAGALLPAAWLVVRGLGAGRRLALTFDDGPDARTLEYLDALDRFGARATFFVVGKLARERADLVAEIARRGHELAGHGFSHRPFPTLSAAELSDELTRTSAFLPSCGRKLVRPPRGATSLRSLVRCARAGYTTILWSVDSDDCRTTSAHKVIEKLDPGRLRSGDILLLHEGQQWTLDAMPPLLQALQVAGFDLVTVGEILSPT
jgi:peptidoglycan/xylan/chitin deacetylase (PgdA/CDA1 family)